MVPDVVVGLTTLVMDVVVGLATVQWSWMLSTSARGMPPWQRSLGVVVDLEREHGRDCLGTTSGTAGNALTLLSVEFSICLF